MARVSDLIVLAIGRAGYDLRSLAGVTSAALGVTLQRVSMVHTPFRRRGSRPDFAGLAGVLG